MKFSLIPLAKENECLALAEVKSLNNLNRITVMLWNEGMSPKGCLVWSICLCISRCLDQMCVFVSTCGVCAQFSAVMNI